MLDQDELLQLDVNAAEWSGQVRPWNRDVILQERDNDSERVTFVCFGRVPLKVPLAVDDSREALHGWHLNGAGFVVRVYGHDRLNASRDGPAAIEHVEFDLD